MTAARLTLALVAAAALGGGVYWAVSERPQERPEPEQPAKAPKVDEPETPTIAKADVVKPPPAPPADPNAGKLQLPNGGYAEPLNGVVNPPKLVWQNPEWSPIVRQEHNAGLDWYVHEDGTYSTTIMMWRPDLNRYDSTSVSLHPRDMVGTSPLASDLPPGVLIPGRGDGKAPGPKK
ncbi:MAG: hypothetical protein NXI31_21225 [bacterium]|nr:hypothetical protein [bacterium]